MGLSPRLCFLHAKQHLWTRIKSLYGSQTPPVLLCMQNSVICTKMTSSHGFQPSSVVLCMQNSDFKTRITSVCRWRDPTCGFCMQNSDFWTRITSLYGSQTSPVIFCMQNSVPSIRITSLHVSQPSSEVFACKTATFGSEKQISMGPRHHLSFCAFNTSWLVPGTLVSLCPNPYLWFLHSKQRLLDSNNKSLWVPDITCRFVHTKQRD